MAQYFTDFSSNTTDAFPSDWTAYDVHSGTNYATNVRADAGATGGKWLEISPTDTATKVAWYLLAWNDIDADANRANVEVEFRYKIVGSAAVNDHDIYAMARGADLGTTSKDLYSAGNRFNGRVDIAKALNTEFTATYLNAVTQTISSDTWYRINARFNGTSIEVTQWADSVARPGTPTTSATDSDITAAGSVGLNLFSSIDGNILVDWVGVGTNGDTAPTTTVSVNTAVNLLMKDEAGNPLANLTGLRYILSSARTPDLVADANIIAQGSAGTTDANGVFSVASGQDNAGTVFGVGVTTATGTTGEADSHRGTWRVKAAEAV